MLITELDDYPIVSAHYKTHIVEPESVVTWINNIAEQRTLNNVAAKHCSILFSSTLRQVVYFLLCMLVGQQLILTASDKRHS